MNPGAYSRDELRALGLARVGENVRVHRSVLFFGPAEVALGANVQIDAYTVITAGPGRVVLGRYVHLGVGCSLFGAAGIVLEDFSGLSGRVSIYSSSDDYSGAALTNPTVPGEFRNPTTAPVRLARHVIVGCGAVVMPGVEIGLGAAVGALSLVRDAVPDFTIVAGTPARKIGDRSRRLLDLETRLAEAEPKVA